MKTILLALTLCLSFKALAAQSIPEMKQTAITAFLKEANNPQSNVGKTIAGVNEQNTDGRNPEGSIALPVKKADFHVALLSHEFLINPWHYANRSDDGKTCFAGGDSAQFLILLTSQYGVHMAQETETVPFKVSVSEHLTAKRKDGGVIEYCEDVAYDEKGEYEVAPVEIQVDGIATLEINEKN